MTKKDPVRLSKLRQTSQAVLAASSFSSWVILTQLLYFGTIEANKIAKNKVEPILWDTLYIHITYHKSTTKSE